MTTTVANQNYSFTATAITFARPQVIRPATRQRTSFIAVLLKALSAFTV